MPSRIPNRVLSQDLAELGGFVRWIQATLTIAGLCILVGLWMSSSQDPTRYISVLVVWVIVAISEWQLRVSSLRAIQVLCVGLWLLASAGMALMAGVHSANVLIYPFVLGVAGWILGRRWLWSMTAITVLFVVGLGSAEMAGLFVPTARTSTLPVMVQVAVLLIAIAILIYQGRRVFTESRKRAIALSEALEAQMQELAARQREVVEIFRNVPAAVASFDAESRLRNCNRRYAALFGGAPEDFIGRAIHAYVPAAQLEFLLPQWNLTLQGTAQNYRRMNVEPHTGETLWLDANLIPEWDGDRVVGLYAMLVDVTAKVKAQAELQALNDELEVRVARRTAELAQTTERLNDSREELVRSQAKAGLAALVASVSHELSTPIGNSVLVGSSLVDMTDALQAMVESNQLKKSTLLEHNRALGESGKLLVANLARAEALLKSFKQVSADQASEQRRSFDLAEMVAEVVSSLAPALKRRPYRIVQDITGGIVMDSLPGPLGQVIINLINNAYNHAFEGRSQGLLTIGAVVRGPMVHIRVADDGVGMSQELLSRIFEPFFSTKIGNGGTGLGMSIVESIVAKTLGGSIQVHSVLGEGSVFEIVLPLTAPH